jgi:hypothetical protein
MVNNIYVDIDGVLRLLDVKCFGKPAKYWHQKNDKMQSLIEIVNENLNVLLEAEPTEYLPYFNTWPKLTLLTSQLEAWKPYTEAWLKAHLTVPYTITYTLDANDKLDHLEKGDYVIDDSPMFSNFKQVILVHKKYNKKAEAPLRIHNSFELSILLGMLKRKKKEIR